VKVVKTDRKRFSSLLHEIDPELESLGGENPINVLLKEFDRVVRNRGHGICKEAVCDCSSINWPRCRCWAGDFEESLHSWGDSGKVVPITRSIPYVLHDNVASTVVPECKINYRNSHDTVLVLVDLVREEFLSVSFTHCHHGSPLDESRV